MGSIRYTTVDRGRLVSGHSPDTEYQFDIDFKQFDPGSKRVAYEQQSLSGKRFTQFIRLDYTGSISTIIIQDTAIRDQMMEFYDSVLAGETFYIDPYGTTASPSEEYSARLIGDLKQARYRYQEAWTYSFKFHYKPTETVIT